MQHLSEHAQLVSVQCMTQVHPDWVRRISYIWHNHSFISCSNSPTNSLVMKDIGRKRKSYVFKIRKVCFLSLVWTVIIHVYVSPILQFVSYVIYIVLYIFTCSCVQYTCVYNQYYNICIMYIIVRGLYAYFIYRCSSKLLTITNNIGLSYRVSCAMTTVTDSRCL